MKFMETLSEHLKVRGQGIDLSVLDNLHTCRFPDLYDKTVKTSRNYCVAQKRMNKANYLGWKGYRFNFQPQKCFCESNKKRGSPFKSTSFSHSNIKSCRKITANMKPIHEHLLVPLPLMCCHLVDGFKFVSLYAWNQPAAQMQRNLRWRWFEGNLF